MYLVSEFVGALVLFMFVDFVCKGFAIPVSPDDTPNTQNNTVEAIGNVSENSPSKSAMQETNDMDDCIYKTRNLDDLAQNQFMKLLTSDCRYDRLTKPDTSAQEPLNITVRMDIRHIELRDQLQFRMEALIQYRYVDSRLNYERISPKRNLMIGRDMVKDRIWIPHVIVAHEKEAKVTGLEGKDVFVSISPQGEVSYAYRTSISIYCWMNLRKFPFDKQICRMNFQSWTYNAKRLMLYWEDESPVKIAAQLHLTEFILEEFWTDGLFVEPPFASGPFGGKYSALEFKFKVAREIGYYLMDYFIPSIILVATSWVTFWLQADNGAPRAMLGTSTMLSFITLSSGQTKTLPKVSYIKISEIWFLGCSIFIFASMVEFAFVNLIFRRRKNVELKKVNSRYILKSTLTPSLARKELYQSTLFETDIYCSTPSLNGYTGPHLSTQSLDVNSKQESLEEGGADAENNGERLKTWTTMTPQEAANWIDTRSRLVFPIAFLLFNIFFWTSALSVSTIQ